MSDYQKYLKYKKKYLAIKKHLRGGGECIGEKESNVFINAVKNKKYLPSIKSLPEDRSKSYPAMDGYPTNLRQQEIFPNQFEDVLKFLKEGNILNLTLQTNPPTRPITKHSILLYFNQKKNTIELWDSNGYCLGPKTWIYLEKLLDYLENTLKAKRIVSNESHHNINHLDGGHCDALSLFYAVLRQNGYYRAQDIYTIDWTNKANIKNLNTYIRESKIEELKNFENNGFILLEKFEDN